MGDVSDECAGHGRTGFQELCADPSVMGPCVITLKHEVMAADELASGSQDVTDVQGT
jgi:hypothetical protein